jgi:hypothetical protein
LAVPAPLEGYNPLSTIVAAGATIKDANLVAGILGRQWSLFMTARHFNNISLMQAVSTQGILENLVGSNASMSLSEYWNARDKLARRDAFIEAHESADLSPITSNPDVQMRPLPHPPLPPHASQSMAKPPCNSSEYNPRSRFPLRYRSMNSTIGNWIRRCNATTRMMEIGDFFIRADHALGRVNCQNQRKKDHRQSRE